MYDITTREETQPQRAPLQRYVVRYSNATICYPFGIYYVYSNGATSFLYPGHKNCQRLSNEAAYRLHESRGHRPGILEAFVEVHINLLIKKKSVLS
jgi:hypothetical protein